MISLNEREPFSIVLRQSCLLITAVLETAQDFAEYERAFSIAKRAYTQATEARDTVPNGDAPHA